MARIMFAMLCLLSASGPPAVVFPARTTSLLQGGLHKVSNNVPPRPVATTATGKKKSRCAPIRHRLLI